MGHRPAGRPSPSAEPVHPVTERRIELREYLSILGRRRHLVVSVFLATLAVAVIVTLLRPTTWTATATLRVEPAAALVGGSVQADDGQAPRSPRQHLFATGDQQPDARPARQRVATRRRAACRVRADRRDEPGRDQGDDGRAGKGGAGRQARRLAAHLRGQDAGQRRRTRGRELVPAASAAAGAREGPGGGAVAPAARDLGPSRPQRAGALAGGAHQRDEPAARSAAGRPRALRVQSDANARGVC